VNIAAVKNPREMISRTLCLSLTCFVLCTCSKPTQSPSAEQEPTLEAEKPAAAREKEPADSIATPAAPDRPLEQSSPGAVEAPAQTAELLRRKFLNTQDTNERIDIVHALGELESAEAVAVLGLLFQNERDEELKLEMLTTLEQMEVENVSMMPIVAAALRPEQPQSVREAAIDVLADLDEPGALQMLQSLTTDPDPEVRAAAKDALQSVMESEATPSP